MGAHLTGYGNQTALFLPRLQALGHEIVLGAFYGLEGRPAHLDGVLMLPGGRDHAAIDVLAADAEHIKADIVLTLYDAWVFPQTVTRQFRWVPWLPIDHLDVPPAVLQSLGTAWQPIAYSRFGHQLLQEAGVDALYVPHGIDTAVFAPLDRSEARQRADIPEDVFLAGIVAANKGFPSRKAFDQQIRAFADLHRRHPDTMLYLHTNMHSGNGIKIQPIIEDAGIPSTAIVQVDPYKYSRGMLDGAYMQMMYSAMDVNLNATMGEGFGLTTLEAMACGTPSIVTDATASPELVPEGTGWTVGYVDKFRTLQEGYRVIPSVVDITDRLEAAYGMSREDREAMGQRAREWVVAEYDADFVAERYWKPVLDQLAERIADEKARKEPVIMSAGRTFPAPKTECDNGHDWSPTGIYVGKGVMHVPCRRAGCEWGFQIEPDGTRKVVEGAFPNAVNGIALDIEDDPQGGVAKIVMHEIATSYHLDEIDFEPGDVVLDIGAQVGVVSCYLGKKYPDIWIYAFEPVPANMERLRQNLWTNKVKNVTAVSQAVSGDGRMLTLHGNLEQNSGGISAFTPNGHGEPAYEVPSMTLVDIWEKFGLEKVKLLKIDAEGAEYEILSRLAEVGPVEHIRGEFHSNSLLEGQGYTPQKLLDDLKEHVADVQAHACPIAG